jgi:hypothetical protein
MESLQNVGSVQTEMLTHHRHPETFLHYCDTYCRYCSLNFHFLQRLHHLHCHWWHWWFHMYWDLITVSRYTNSHECFTWSHTCDMFVASFVLLVSVCLVLFALIVHPFSHTCNIGHINHRLQFMYYNTTYLVVFANTTFCFHLTNLILAVTWNTHMLL